MQIEIYGEAEFAAMFRFALDLRFQRQAAVRDWGSRQKLEIGWDFIPLQQALNYLNAMVVVVEQLLMMTKK